MEKQLQLQDDAALVQDYINGNERALEMLIKRHKLRIYNFIYSKVFDRDTARANLNFPIQPGFEYKGFIHWDYDPETKPQNVQGVLALADQTDENMGGFQCIPWLFQNYDSWKLGQPKDRNRFQPDITGLEDKLVKVKLEAGDLLIFNSCLPHGIRPNMSKDKVRIAQYISMMPAEEENEALKKWRINSWKNRVAPEGYAFPGDPRNWEQTKYTTAQLSPLGEKLLGQSKW